MENIEIKKINKDPIHLQITKKSIESVVVFISGSGDTKDVYTPITKILEEKDFPSTLVSFSFRGRDEGREYSHTQQIEDLEDVLDYLIREGFSKITLIPTSMGFISVACVLNNQKYTTFISEVLMLDPADYPIDMSRETWTGMDEFIPTTELYSNLLKNISSNLKISIVHFSLRNFDKNYKAKTDLERGVDNPEAFCRLNKDMELNIFNNVPEKNRGEFLEDYKLPHAFSRDGDINKNHKIVAEYILTKTH